MEKQQGWDQEGGYGWKARIGWLAPQTVVETDGLEFAWMFPPGYMMVYTLLGIRERTPAEWEGALGRIADVARTVAQRHVAVIGTGGAPAYIYKGYGSGQHVIRIIEEATGIPGMTGITASENALRRLGASRIAVATPWKEDLNDLMRRYWAKAGIEVVHIRGLATESILAMDMLPLKAPYELACQVLREAPSAEALYMPNGLWPTGMHIDRLEREFGVPVVTTTQSLTWQALSILNAKEQVTGYGRIFDTLLEDGS